MLVRAHGSFAVRGVKAPSVLPRNRRIYLKRLAVRGVSVDTDSTTNTEEQSTQEEEEEQGGKVYVGKGRFIVDDPTKYPGRDDWLTGGWAGGEVGLQGFIQDEKPGAKAENEPISKSEEKDAPKGSGEDLIYIGYDKAEKRSPGTQGRFVRDRKERYPDKESLGVLANVTGGFAGGEQGVKMFVEEGDITFRPPGSRSGQFSPVIVAAVVAVTGISASFLLTGATEEAQGIMTTGLKIQADILASPIDDKTIFILQAAVGLLAVIGVVGAARTAVSGVQHSITTSVENLTHGAQKLAVSIAFWGVVALLFKYVAEH